jgi:hypothetical protein
MKFELDKAIEILRQTPYTLMRMLDGLSPEWTRSRGDMENWSPYDVIGHLIHGEETDWIPRAEIILEHGTGRPFDKYDRLAQFERSKGRPLSDLLQEFAHLRSHSLEKLVNFGLTPERLALKGMHPALGEVTLEQLLSAWVVHDLNHIRQIVAYMAREYSEAVGPWKEYLSIIDKN